MCNSEVPTHPTCVPTSSALLPATWTTLMHSLILEKQIPLRNIKANQVNQSKEQRSVTLIGCSLLSQRTSACGPSEPPTEPKTRGPANIAVPREDNSLRDTYKVSSNHNTTGRQQSQQQRPAPSPQRQQKRPTGSYHVSSKARDHVHISIMDYE